MQAQAKRGAASSRPQEPFFVVRRAEERGGADHGWLQTRHTFSFASYWDPAWSGFRDLLVLNDDRVQGGAGFGAHPHRDMEILSWVLAGGLAHRDSTGEDAVLRPGVVQRMSAGTGVVHSEFNASDHDPLRFLQIWIVPDRRGHKPSYEEAAVPVDERRGQLAQLAGPAGAGAKVAIHQDAHVYAGLVDGDERIVHAVDPARYVWVHVARGTVSLNGTALSEGDGVGLHGASELHFDDGHDAEVLVFDLA